MNIHHDGDRDDEWMVTVEKHIHQLSDQIPLLDSDSLIRQMRKDLASAVPVEELVEMEVELWALFSDVTIRASGERPYLHQMASAWSANTYRQARASFLLAAGGLVDTAVGNARSAIEHAIYLSLLAGSSDVDEILDPLEQRSRNLWERNSEIIEAPEIVDIMLSQLQPIARRENDEWVSKVQQVCDHLETGPLVYLHYRLLSSMLHPGLTSASPYLLTSMQSLEAPLALTPTVAAGGALVLMLAVSSCVWAGWAIDQIFETDAFAETVAPIAARLELRPLTRIK